MAPLQIVCNLANYLTYMITCVLTASSVIKMTCIVKTIMLLLYMQLCGNSTHSKKHYTQLSWLSGFSHFALFAVIMAK